MTERLYYLDPARQEFDATIVDVGARDGLTLVRLDQSAFYPTSGGQPFDLGTLGGAHVADVFDETDDPSGDVIHAVEGGGDLKVGDRVHGTIDWTRRFDHMQQHTGQHLLSAGFDTLFDVPTVSFHMGAELATIDLARAVTPEQLAAGEDAANRVVWEDRPVAIRFATEEEAAQLPLRKPPKKKGTLRLIEIERWDLSACGGTHVARTGEVGIVAITGWERVKSGMRVEFACGARALRHFRLLRDTAHRAAGALSAPVGELPQSIDRLLSDVKEQRKAIAALQGELARYRAAELASAAEFTAQGRVVAGAIDADAPGLKSLASAVTAQAGIVAVLVSVSSPALIVIARSGDLTIRSNDVLSALTAKFGGRGGGKPDLAQGGGLNASTEAILAAAREAIAKA